jgi:hypothetical protein
LIGNAQKGTFTFCADHLKAIAAAVAARVVAAAVVAVAAVAVAATAATVEALRRMPLCFLTYAKLGQIPKY